MALACLTGFTLTPALSNVAFVTSIEVDQNLCPGYNKLPETDAFLLYLTHSTKSTYFLSFEIFIIYFVATFDALTHQQNTKHLNMLE